MSTSLTHCTFAPLTLALLGAMPLAASAQTAQATKVCDNCFITSMSHNGQQATGQMLSNSETFYWKHGKSAQRLGRSTADVLGVVGGVPAMSADGKKIASSILSNDGTLMTSGLWSDGAWTQLTPPLPDDAGAGDQQDSTVWAISGDGSQVAGLYWRYGHTGGSAHPMYWTAQSQMVGLPTTSGSGRINGMNKTGSVMAGWEEGSWGNWMATVWAPDGTRTTLGSADNWSIANAVSRNGKHVVGQDVDPATFLNAAYEWTWDGQAWVAKNLGNLQGTVDGSASANGVSANGKIVVGFGTQYWGPGGMGFVWTQRSGKMRTAKDFFAKYGYTDPAFDITNVMAVTPDGLSFAVVERQNVSPWTTRSQIITLSQPAD